MRASNAAFVFAFVFLKKLRGRKPFAKTQCAPFIGGLPRSLKIAKLNQFSTYILPIIVIIGWGCKRIFAPVLYKSFLCLYFGRFYLLLFGNA